MPPIYRVELDAEHDYSFGGPLADISDYVESPISLGFGLQSPYNSIAAPGFMSLKLHNYNGDLDLDNPSAKYYDKFRIGSLIRVSFYDPYSGTFPNLAVMQIVNPTPRIEGEDKKLYIECGDIVAEFLDAEYTPPLQTNVLTSEALATMHAKSKLIYPYPDYYQFVDYTSIGDGRAPFDGSDWFIGETGVVTLPFVGDNLGRDSKMTVRNFVRDVIEAEPNSIYFFDCRNQTFRFLNRNHATEHDPAPGPWILIDNFQAEYTKPNKYMVNTFTVNYYPRRVGDEHSELYESDSVPFSIPPRETRSFTIRYRDPDNPSASVGALNVDDPIIGVDIIANDAEDGNGTDRSGMLYVSLVKGAASSELNIHNRRRRDEVFITALRINGTPLIIQNKESVTEINTDSVYRHKTIPDYKNLYGISDVDSARDYARFMVDSYGELRETIERVRVSVASGDADTMSKLAFYTIGQPLHLIDNQKGHDDIYMIVGERHDIDPNRGRHVVTYTVRSTGQGQLFTLGTSTYDEGDVLSY